MRCYRRNERFALSEVSSAFIAKNGQNGGYLCQIIFERGYFLFNVQTCEIGDLNAVLAATLENQNP